MSPSAHLKRIAAGCLSVLLVAASAPDAAAYHVGDRRMICQGLTLHLENLKPLLPAVGPIEPNIISTYLIQNAQPLGAHPEQSMVNRLFVESMASPDFARELTRALRASGDVGAPTSALAATAARVHDADTGILWSEMRRLEVLRRSFLQNKEDDPGNAARPLLEFFDGENADLAHDDPAAHEGSIGTEPDAAIGSEAAPYQIGGIIQESRTVDEALARLRDLKLKGQGAALASFDLNRGKPIELLREIWMEVSAHAPARIPIDSTRKIPALVVNNSKIDFHLHEVPADLDIPPLLSILDAWSLIRSLRREGGDIYGVGEIIPAYSLGSGHEIKERLASSGKKVVVGKPGYLQWWGRRAGEIGVLALAGAVYAGLIDEFVYFNNGFVDTFTVYSCWAGALLVLAWAVPLLLIPLGGLLLLPIVKILEFFTARFGGAPAANLRETAVSLRRQILRLDAIADPQKIRGASFPMPLRLSDGGDRRRNLDALSRSQAVADAVLEDAIKRRIREAHVLCGLGQAEEIAWFLSRLKPAASTIPD